MLKHSFGLHGRLAGNWWATRVATAIGSVCLVVALLAALPASSSATFGGRNGRIAWSYYVTAAGASNFSIVTVPGGGGLDHTVVSCNDLHGAAYCPAWQDVTFAPSGKRLLWVILTQKKHKVIVKTNPDGSGRRPTIHHANENDFQPSYSPTGNRIAYVRQLDGQAKGSIATSDLAGNNVRVLTPRMFGLNPQWSPDAKQIVFTHNKTVWSVTPDGRNLRPIIPNGAYPSFSPNGRQILYTGFESTNVFTSRPDGTHRQQVPIDCVRCANGGATFAVFSPDGKRIAFATPNSDGRLALYTVSTAGGEPRQIDSSVVSGGAAGTSGLAWQPLH